MTKRATKKAAPGSAAEETEAPAVRIVKYVVNRPYSAGEPYDVVDAEVKHEYDDEADLLHLKLINPPRGVEDDVKRVRRSEDRALGTWFDPAAPSEEVAE
jgi:hypothetical protein